MLDNVGYSRLTRKVILIMIPMSEAGSDYSSILMAPREQV